MHIFHQAVIVAIVYRHADNHWALHREGFFSVDEIGHRLQLPQPHPRRLG